VDSRGAADLFQWFNEDHLDAQHRYDYREWFNRVNQQPHIAGNGPYLTQVRTAALATLTDAEKADPELAQIRLPIVHLRPAGEAVSSRFDVPSRQAVSRSSLRAAAFIREQEVRSCVVHLWPAVIDASRPSPSLRPCRMMSTECATGSPRGRCGFLLQADLVALEY